MKKFKIKYDYILLYIGKERFNGSDWYHCALISEITNEVELIIDYKLDDEKRFYNLRTIPVKDYISWNIGNNSKWAKDILDECDIIISKLVESLGDFENESDEF